MWKATEELQIQHLPQPSASLSPTRQGRCQEERYSQVLHQCFAAEFLEFYYLFCSSISMYFLALNHRRARTVPAA